MFCREGFFIENGVLKIEKDSDSELDYTLDWTTWLDGDDISAMVLTTSGTDISMTSASGDSGILASTATDFSTNFKLNDLVDVSGFLTNPVNNGIFRITGAPTANSMPIQKINGDTLVDEAAGDNKTLKNEPSEWALPSPLTEPQASIATTKKTTVWLAGGVAGTEYEVINRIRTVLNRKEEQVVVVVCK